jgi:antirestriction protein ArdC
MLKVASKFHRYSFNNHLMIYCQRPDATLVAGFRKWQQLGRNVRKGEKGLAILAPCKYRAKIEDEDGDEQVVQSVRGFRIVYVFDISQTEGEPLEALDAVSPELLCGGSPDGLWEALVAQANAAGFEVVRKSRLSENGYCDFGTREIGIRPDADDLQAVKTLVHELAHALLHGGDLIGDRSRQEIEVESVAFIVLDALGMNSDSYSFPYVARWTGGDVQVIAETGARVVSCAKSILDQLETADLTTSPA